MLRFLITLSVTAVLSAVAQAQPQPLGEATSLEVNRHGVGHLLVVPYFSTQAGNATLVNLFNASDAAKAVLLRYRSAGNGDELFSLQVFLRAHDAGAAMLYSGSSGGVPSITTADASCTLPANVSGQSFRTSRLNPALAGDALANQAREGYIEIIALGDVVADSALDAAITPVDYGVVPPCTPAVLSALARFDAQLAPPTTGLFANWILINVPQTTTWSGEAVAYEARLDGAPSTGNVVYFPPTTTPLSAQDVTDYSADPLFNFAQGGPVVVPLSRDLPDLSTPYTATVETPQDQATELSFEIAAQKTAIEYLTDRSIQALTDWVFSMPTLRYHAAVDHRGPKLINNGSTFGNERSVYFPYNTMELSPAGQLNYSELPHNWVTGFGREAEWTTLSDDIAPFFRSVKLAGAVAVLSLSGDHDAPSWSALRASATRTVLWPLTFGKDGYAEIRWASLFGPDWVGQAVLVRHFSRVVNPAAAPGVSGTYGFTGAGRTLVPGAPPW